jgi:phosphomannomutase
MLTNLRLCVGVRLQDHPGSTIVTDSVTSDGLTKFIEARGGKHLRWVNPIVRMQAVTPT